MKQQCRRLNDRPGVMYRCHHGMSGRLDQDEGELLELRKQGRCVGAMSEYLLLVPRHELRKLERDEHGLSVRSMIGGIHSILFSCLDARSNQGDPQGSE